MSKAMTLPLPWAPFFRDKAIHGFAAWLQALLPNSLPDSLAITQFAAVR